jgi:hypothetical protein
MSDGILPLPTFSEFIGWPELLGPDFTGPSWDNWRITMKAALGEDMTAAERLQFRELAGRDPPPGRVRELWLAIGRRAGKDSLAAALASYLAICSNFDRYLRRGERATILCLAVNRDQAGIVFGYIRANFEIPHLARFVEKVGDDSIELSNGVDILVATNSFRGLRGRTIGCAILDECAYWFSDEYANPDKEVYASLLPGLTTLRQAGAMIVAISTVYRRGGLLFEKWLRHHERDDPQVLAIRQPSAVYNPLLETDALLAAEIAEQRRTDPERAAADWDSIWRSDLADFVDRDAVEACVAHGRYELPHEIGLHYRAFVDTSGSGADPMTMAVAHFDRKTNKAILDLVREIKPPFSTEAATAEFAATIKSYRCSEVQGDDYGAAWPKEAFRRHGIHYIKFDRNKSQLYVEFLPLINSGRVELLDHRRMIHQLVRLERRTSRGTGRDIVDHPRGEHDDLINSAAGACVLTTGKRGPIIVHPDVLARSAIIKRDPRTLLDPSMRF